MGHSQGARLALILTLEKYLRESSSGLRVYSKRTRAGFFGRAKTLLIPHSPPHPTGAKRLEQCLESPAASFGFNSPKDPVLNQDIRATFSEMFKPSKLLQTSLVCSFLVAAFTLTQSAPTHQTPQKRTVAGTVVFAVNKYPDGATVDPIVIINNGQYIDPLPDDEAFTREVGEKYLRPGQKHRVIFGGAEAGTVTVGKST